jgi:hypothetical protein
LHGGRGAEKHLARSAARALIARESAPAQIGHAVTNHYNIIMSLEAHGIALFRVFTLQDEFACLPPPPPLFAVLLLAPPMHVLTRLCLPLMGEKLLIFQTGHAEGALNCVSGSGMCKRRALY